MRVRFCAAAALLLCLLLGLPGFAAELGTEFTIDPEEGLSAEAAEAVGSFDAANTPAFGARLLQLLADALKTLSPSLRSGLCAAGLMLAAVLLCSLLDGLQAGRDALRFAAVLAILGAGAGGMQAMVSMASKTLNEMRDYSLLLLPGLASLSVFAGASATGAATCTGGVLFFDVLLRLSSGLVMPLVWLMTAAAAADTALGGGRLRSMYDFLKWIAAGVLKWTSYLFTGYLGVTGVLCGAVDAVRLRTARAALSSAVPVVGGIISDASDSIVAAAAMVKNAAGVYGLLAVLAICLAPFLRLAVQLVILRATAALAGLFGQSELTGLIQSLSDAMGLLLALTGAFCTAALVSVVLCMKAAGV